MKVNGISAILHLVHCS